MREEIKNRTFREDLYHRLSVIIIEVPPLNKRIEDIPLLVNHFIASFCTEQGKALMGIKEEALEELKKINWTGNIRELKNVVERLVILCEDPISSEDVQRYVHPLF